MTETLWRYSVKTSASVILGNNSSLLTCNHSRILNKKHRRNRLERFILTLSDQQLVTGLGILIAGFSTLCTRQVYHFKIISALAWFSSTTHLSTLAVLRVYFMNHRSLRAWRVVAMACIFVLLILTLVITILPLKPEAQTLCVFSSWKSPGDRPGALSRMLEVILILIYLIITYRYRILGLYPIATAQGLTSWLLGREPKGLPSLEEAMISACFSKSAQEIAIHRRVRYRQRLAYFVESQKQCHTSTKELMYLNTELLQSFLLEILTIFFGLVFGISQVVVYRSLAHPSQFVGNENTLGFGQLVALLLIMLPIMTAGEIYNGR